MQRLQPDVATCSAGGGKKIKLGFPSFFSDSYNMGSYEGFPVERFQQKVSRTIPMKGFYKDSLRP